MDEDRYVSELREALGEERQLARVACGRQEMLTDLKAVCMESDGKSARAVRLVAGASGTGKSSLMACLCRELEKSAFVMLVCGRIHARVIAAVRSLGDSTTSVRDVLLMARRLKLVRRGGSWELANAWRKDLELLEAARLRAGAPHRRRVIRARCCGTGVISLKTCMTVFRPKRILTSTIVGTSASSGGNGLFAHNGVVESIPIAIIVENHKERGIQDRYTPIAVDQFYLLGQDAALLGLG